MPFGSNGPRSPRTVPQMTSSAGLSNRTGPISDWNLLSLRGDVGRKGRNRPADVVRLEALLGAAGYLDLSPTDGPTGYFGERLDRAVRKFQKDHGVPVDGEVKPGGKTVAQLFQETGVEKDDDPGGPALDPDPRDPDDGSDDKPDPGWFRRVIDWFFRRTRHDDRPILPPGGPWPGPLRG